MENHGREKAGLIISCVSRNRWETAIALLEAKSEDKLPSLGIQQAKDYMKKFNVPFVFSTNGHLCAEYAEDTGQITDALPLTAFPTPQDLGQRV